MTSWTFHSIALLVLLSGHFGLPSLSLAKEKHRGRAISSLCEALPDLQQRCLAGKKLSKPVTLQLQVFLDEAYQQKWVDWRERFNETLTCTNWLYEPIGVRWELKQISDWSPGEARHDLFKLLADLRTAQQSFAKRYRPRNLPIFVGITLWEENRVYSSGGGEIGLSQGNACVAPAWPRIENDCLILAHELGHLLRAQHIAIEGDVMGKSTHTFHLPANDALQRVSELFRFDPTNAAIIKATSRHRFGINGPLLSPACYNYVDCLTVKDN